MREAPPQDSADAVLCPSYASPDLHDLLGTQWRERLDLVPCITHVAVIRFPGLLCISGRL
jgi:hypothetical protein